MADGRACVASPSKDDDSGRTNGEGAKAFPVERRIIPRRPPAYKRGRRSGAARALTDFAKAAPSGTALR